VRPLIELQASLSRVPAADELLVETITLRDGFHAFVYPFGGRLAHEGLGAPAGAPSLVEGHRHGLRVPPVRDVGLHERTHRADLLRDPLSLKRLHSKLLFGLVDASRRVFSRPIAAPCPLHAAIGSNDRIVSYTAAQRYFATHEPDADLRIIDAAYHELHNETAPYREPYFAYLKQAFARN